MPRRSSAKSQPRRIETAFLALSDNTREAHMGAWTAWQQWAAEHRWAPLPATAEDVAVYLQARHAGGAAPATIRVARAAIAKVHRISGLTDPTTDNLYRDELRRIGREGRNRGRGRPLPGGVRAHHRAAVPPGAARRPQQRRSLPTASERSCASEGQR